MKYRHASSSSNPGGGPGYGRYFKGKGGVVTIASKDGKKRVPIAPAFDPLAVSMVPIPGWKAGPVGVPAAGLFIPGSALVAARGDASDADVMALAVGSSRVGHVWRDHDRGGSYCRDCGLRSWADHSIGGS